MNEKIIEQRLRKQIEQAGGKAYKLESPGTSGMPDRLVILKNGVLAFIETKKPKGGVLSERQKYIHEQLRSYGQIVIVASTPNEVDQVSEMLILESKQKGGNAE